jgi:Cytochrome c
MLLHAAQPEPVPSKDNRALVEAGRQLYVNGQRGDGSLLQGSRQGNVSLQGKAAACISCHRASGMGSVEGNSRIAPISGRFLFAAADDLVIANMDGIRGKTLNRSHPPYTEASLQSALRDGINANGLAMGPLMPRFDLDATDRAALMAYLAQLSTDYSPGVSKEAIRFATVITPEVAPARRAIFKQMLQTALRGKNSSTAPRKRYMTSAAAFVSQSERHWDVDFWELQGAPETWAAQLDALQQRKPVFALLSGLSETDWSPVDQFCSRQHVPCWFPSVSLPALAEPGYGLYFSQGVALEARVLAKHLQAQQAGGTPLRRALQIYLPGSAGEQAAQALRAAFALAGTPLQDRPLASAETATLRAALGDVRSGDAVVLWLGGEQMRLLQGLKPPAAGDLYLSASLVDAPARAGLSGDWSARLQLLYPYELPQVRQANLAYLHSWLKLQGIALVDEEMQSELFFSLNLMTDTLQDMLDNLYRDYLVERTEDNIGKREAAKAEQESRDRHILGAAGRRVVRAEKELGNSQVSLAGDATSAQRLAFAVGESAGTTVYPHLSLAPGQHFASRGAYVVDLARVRDASAPNAAALEWIAP